MKGFALSHSAAYIFALIQLSSADAGYFFHQIIWISFEEDAIPFCNSSFCL